MKEKQCILCDSFWVIHSLDYRSLIIRFNCVDCGFGWDEIDWDKVWFS